MRLDREKMLAHCKDGDERVLLARALDRAEIVLRSGLTQVTDFYDPYHAGLIISTLRAAPGLAATPEGGYASAERVRVAVHTAGIQPVVEDYDFGFISINGNFKMTGVTHRDFLGSLLGLGLRREKFGDIFVVEEGARAVVAGEVTSYILANLNKVGRIQVSVTEITDEAFQPPEHAYKEIRATVASMRLDAVASAGFGTSRSKIVREIEADRFSVNWRVSPNPSAPVQEGDILSARGRGRVKVAEVRGPLKSGRIGLLLKKFI